jgi:hypothetical protein
MRKTLLGLFFLPLIVSNTSQVETTVKTEVAGENASAHTEITNIVNGEETKVVSDEPGEIKVEVKDGEVKIESSSEVQPTVVISEPSQEEIEEKKEETSNRVEEMKERVFSFFENWLGRLRERLSWVLTRQIK